MILERNARASSTAERTQHAVTQAGQMPAVPLEVLVLGLGGSRVVARHRHHAT
jgi:hypothetical protein